MYADRLNYFGALALASPEISLDPKNFNSRASSDGANAEAMEILGRSFSDPRARVCNRTLMAVLFLIERATITGDHSLALVHEEGLKSVLNLRGNLDELELEMELEALIPMLV